MSESVISIRNLTKTYKLYNNPVDRVKEVFHPFRKKYFHPFNALSDISFDVLKGETLGIIGRNGSGKSTLLQLVCGILQPTEGSIMVNGRVSALLELGAGFNPAFTGRENVYINGAILGLSRNEMNDRFEDIAAFADIGNFIDQPVKTYSSGMYVRLAFAVAINVDPDILIVDEALSVGDEAFQRKCFVRIKQIQERGDSILFVSHGAGTVIELCNRVLLFDQGELLIGGSPKQVVSYYYKMIFAHPERIEDMKKEWQGDPDRLNLVCDENEEENKNESEKNSGNGVGKKEKSAQESFYVPDMVPKSTIYYEKHGAVIDNSHLTTLDGRQVNILVNGEEYIYTYAVFFEQPAFQVRFSMLLKTLSGFELGGAVTAPMGEGIDYVESGTCWNVKFCFRCILNPGTYFLNVGVLGILNGAEDYLDRNIDIAMFRVQDNENKTATAIVDFIKHAEVVIVE